MQRNTLGQVAQHQFMNHNDLRMRTHHTRIFREGEVTSAQQDKLPSTVFLCYNATWLHVYIYYIVLQAYRHLQAAYDSIRDCLGEIYAQIFDVWTSKCTSTFEPSSTWPSSHLPSDQRGKQHPSGFQQPRAKATRRVLGGDTWNGWVADMIVMASC